MLIGGAVLTGLGGMLAALGLTFVSAAVISAGRRWQQRTEMTPGQLAKHAIGAAQSARQAGVGAWRDPVPPRAAPSAGARRASTDGVPVS
jgi:hypothetical protein